MQKQYKHSSEALMEIVQNKQFKDHQMTYDDVLNILGKRSFGILLLFFALPCLLPLTLLPGFAAIFCLPILIFSSQIILGKKKLWLPKKIAQRKINQKTVSEIIHKAVPYLKILEHFLKPRWDFMISHVMEKINGLVIFFLALILMIPIPFSNLVFALLLISFALGFIAHDGVFILLGYAGAIIYIGLIYLVVLTTINSILF